MKSVYLFLLAAISIAPAVAQQAVNDAPVETPSNSSEVLVSSPNQTLNAEQWMQRLSNAMRTLSFDTSFVVVRNNRAEPYRWLHGVQGEQQIEFLTLLNGARSESVRLNSTVSYFESDKPPYSVRSRTIRGPVPAALFTDVDKLQQTYHFILGGKSRVLGRQAQLIRLESKDKNRYGYWFWLDIETGLMLRGAIVSKEGEILEQIQFTHLQLRSDASELFSQVADINLPEVVTSNALEVTLPWSVTYLPRGFEQVSSAVRYIPNVGNQVQSKMFSDGLIDVSVYVEASEQPARQTTLNQTGATVLLTMLRDGHEITVIGKVPAKTAAHIADSIVFNE
ncbi:MucB/RseB C-terminal domain-containing protein [Thalassotalea maritima]|uniref:MucB/RseB C-terminal domain-containing protein n=1 Tax=Thalassotalea maritima TaxID=3242416 RepID=UPI0035279CD8